jgi:hypothetical protein
VPGGVLNSPASFVAWCCAEQGYIWCLLLVWVHPVGLWQVFVLEGACRISSRYAMLCTCVHSDSPSCFGGGEGCARGSARWLWDCRVACHPAPRFWPVGLFLCARCNHATSSSAGLTAGLCLCNSCSHNFLRPPLRGPAADSARCVCLSRAASNLYHPCELWLCVREQGGCRVCLEGGPHHPVSIQGFRGVLLRLCDVFSVSSFPGRSRRRVTSLHRCMSQRSA